ncbi:MAG: phage tail spike protein, partial [Paraclostridium sp.]
LGNLTDTIEAYVEEERNGLFELTFDYPNNYPLSDKLEKECIVIANANDTLRNQKFRIYDTQKFIDGTITVFARHISFDLMYDIVNNVTFTNQSCEYALNQLFRQSQFSTHYRGYSDIINAQDYSMSMCNVLEAIGGKEGSIIDTYGTGAEILRDNTDISVLNRRGHDNGVSIEYAKNLMGFELEEDTTDLITRIIPFAKYTDEASKEVIVKANAVDSPLINNYSHPYVRYIDFSDKFGNGEIPSQQKLIILAQNEYRDKKVDIPKQNYKIEFIPLSKCVGYEGIEDKISLCDLVTIRNSQYNVDTQAKVIKYKFNVLTDRYESMELGEPKTSLGDIIGGGSGEGEQGPPGPQGPPGADGNIGDFPDSLPSKPVMSYTSYGLGAISLTWTYEDKVYYTYEVYASKTANFTPNFNDLIHEGQTSSYLFQAKSGETWYFKTCAKNSHGNRTAFSDQISVKVNTVDDFDEYFSSLAVSRLVADIFSVNYMEAGIIKGNWIDAKQLSVTDGNGKRTLDIDSFGRITMMPSVFKLLVNGKEEDVATLAQLTATNDKFEFKFENSLKNNDVIDARFHNFLHYYPIVENSSHIGKADDVNVDGGHAIYLNGISGTVSAGQKIIPSNLKASKYTISGYMYPSNLKLNTNGRAEINIEVHAEDGSIQYDYISVNANSTKFERYGKALLTKAPIKWITIRCLVRNATGLVYFTSLQVEEGELSPFKLKNTEIRDGVTTVDANGVSVAHKDGSKAKLTSEEVVFTDTNDIRKMAINKGRLCFYDANTNNNLWGIFTSNSISRFENAKGINLSVSDYHAHFIGLGFHNEPTLANGYTPRYFMQINVRDYGDPNSPVGTNFYNENVYVHENLRVSKDISSSGNIRISSNSITPHYVGTDATRQKLQLGADVALSLGVQNGDRHSGAVEVVKDPYAPNGVGVKMFCDLDMQGYYSVINSKNVMELEEKMLNSMLATTDMFEMMLMITPSPINDGESLSNNRIINIYSDLILMNEKTIDEVPMIVRGLVVEMLKAR